MGLVCVKRLWRTLESLQPPPLQLGPFVVPILAVLSSRGGAGKQSLPSATYVRIAAMSRPGPHVQRHLGGHAWQRLHQEVGCSHPGLDRPEGMLDRLAPLAPFFRMLR